MGVIPYISTTNSCQEWVRYGLFFLPLRILTSYFFHHLVKEGSHSPTNQEECFS